MRCATGSMFGDDFIKKRLSCFFYPLLVALVDLSIKFLVLTKLKYEDKIRIFGNLIEISYVENEGAAFGIFNQNKYFLILTTIVFIIIYFCIILKKRDYNRTFLFSSYFIIGGGIGNLINRLITGCVIDYIKIFPITYFCNFADYCITLGTIGLIIYTFFIRSDHKSNSRGEKCNFLI